MSANTVYCHVLRGDVTVVTDINGKTTNVVCPKFLRIFQTCEIKGDSSGFLGRVVKRIADKEFGTRERFCEFATQEEML